jgi:hypothetical protein
MAQGPSEDLMAFNYKRAMMDIASGTKPIISDGRYRT